MAVFQEFLNSQAAGGHCAYVLRGLVRDPHVCDRCKAAAVCLVVTIRPADSSEHIPPVGLCRACIDQAFQGFAGG